MPTIQQIIDKVKRLYPNEFTDSDLIDVINDEQREIFTELQQTELYQFTTVADQPTYSMASNMAIEYINYVGICQDATITASSKFNEYKFADFNEEMTSNRYFDGLNGLIGLYPIPTATGWTVNIRYQKRPTLLSSSNMSATPDLNEDWHRIFVYACIIEVAGAGNNPDIDTVNNYTLKYNALMKKITQSRYERMQKYPAATDVMKMSRNSIRSARRFSDSEAVVISDV